MAKDPAFLFYPGDYLRDTQCLSEASQVAYDRIMCEHMRNICITQRQLNFFTKRLTDEEKDDLMMVLTETEGGFMISWVAESIKKRRAYSESRRKNRKSKKQKDMIDICKTYDEHMENEIEIENVNKKEDEKRGIVKGEYLKDISPNANLPDNEYQDANKLPIDDVYALCLNDVWLKNFADKKVNKGATPENILEYFQDFYETKKIDTEKISISDFKKHFQNSINLKIKNYGQLDSAKNKRKSTRKSLDPNKLMEAAIKEQQKRDNQRKQSTAN